MQLLVQSCLDPSRANEIFSVPKRWIFTLPKLYATKIKVDYSMPKNWGHHYYDQRETIQYLEVYVGMRPLLGRHIMLAHHQPELQKKKSLVEKEKRRGRRWQCWTSIGTGEHIKWYNQSFSLQVKCRQFVYGVHLYMSECLQTRSVSQ